MPLLKCLVSDLRMILILVFPVPFILAVAVLLSQKRIGRVILVGVSGDDHTKIVLFIQESFFELAPVGGNCPIREG